MCDLAILVTISESARSDSTVNDSTHKETMASDPNSAGNVDVHTLPQLSAKKNSHTQELDPSNVPAGKAMNLYA